MGALSSVLHGAKSLTSVEGENGEDTTALPPPVLTSPPASSSAGEEGANVSPTKIGLATNQRISRQERRRNDGIHLKAKKNSK